MTEKKEEVICPCCAESIKPDIVYFNKSLEAFRCTKCGIAFPK